MLLKILPITQTVKPSPTKETLIDSKSPGVWLPHLGHFPLDKAINWNCELEGRREASLQCQHVYPDIQDAE